MMIDDRMLLICGDYYIRENVEDGLFYVCDQIGIAEGEDLEHIGDAFPTLELAEANANMWRERDERRT